MRYFMLGVLPLVVALVVGVESPTATHNPTQPGVPEIKPLPGCSKAYTLSQFHRTARKIYRSRSKPSGFEIRTIRRVARCQHSVKSQRLAQRHRRRYAGAQARRYYWQWKQAAIPAWIRGTLRRLRGCETRGIPYPQNYRNNGHHFGAYQYAIETWGRAQRYAGVPVSRRTWSPHVASPAHQDVVTAKFFFPHRGEWQCKV